MAVVAGIINRKSFNAISGVNTRISFREALLERRFGAVGDNTNGVRCPSCSGFVVPDAYRRVFNPE
jgi:hypothetical protein